MNKAIEKARQRANASKRPYMVLSDGRVLLDTQANREKDMGASIIYMARPGGRDWSKPR
jgi:hypothetical protein